MNSPSVKFFPAAVIFLEISKLTLAQIASSLPRSLQKFGSERRPVQCVKFFSLRLLSFASNSARLRPLVSKWRLRLCSFGSNIAFRQTRHNIFEVTTVNMHLLVHSKLNHLPSFSIFLLLLSVISHYSMFYKMLTNKLTNACQTNARVRVFVMSL